MSSKTPTSADYSFGPERPANDVYEELSLGRAQVVEKARELSKISIPTVMPPEGYRPGDNLPPPNQSINARLVSVLASRIMLTALPPGFPMLKYNIIEHKIQEAINQDPQLYSDTLLALSRREKANRDRLESTGIRSAYVEAGEGLIVAGNILWRHLDIDHPSVHKMNTYVVRRSQGGEQLDIVLKLGVSLRELKPSQAMFIRNLMHAHPESYKPDDMNHDQQTVYACQKLWWRDDKTKVWLYWEEFEGEVIPDTAVMVDYDSPIMYAAWMKPVYGANWGISYCEIYEGDMWAVENSWADLHDMADAAAITWIFVKPGGVTSKKVLDKAENVRTMYGDANDITVFRLEKANDAAMVQGIADAAEKRLGQAFLMVSSVQRSGERVTAEEWQQMTAELDMAMGGLYAIFAQGLGKNIVSRFIALQEDEDPSLKPLPKGIIRLGVITGMDAMSINEDEANLENAIGVLIKMAGNDPAVLAQYMEFSELVRRVLAGNTVKPDGLVKGDQQRASEASQATGQATQQQVMGAVMPPVAKEAAKAIVPAVSPAIAKAINARMNPDGSGQPAAANQA